MEWFLFLHLQSSRIRLFQIFHLRRSSSSVAFLSRKWQSMYRNWYIFLLCPGVFLKILYLKLCYDSKIWEYIVFGFMMQKQFNRTWWNRDLTEYLALWQRVFCEPYIDTFHWFVCINFSISGDLKNEQNYN